MKTIHKGSKIFDLLSTTSEGSGNVVDIPLVQIGCSLCLLIKDLFLDVTHKQAHITGPRSTPHSDSSDLPVVAEHHGKENLVIYHSRNFGSEKIVLTRPYVRPPLHVSRGEILHFKYPRVSVVNRIATRTLR